MAKGDNTTIILLLAAGALAYSKLSGMASGLKESFQMPAFNIPNFTLPDIKFPDVTIATPDINIGTPDLPGFKWPSWLDQSDSDKEFTFFKYGEDGEPAVGSTSEDPTNDGMWKGEYGGFKYTEGSPLDRILGMTHDYPDPDPLVNNLPTSGPFPSGLVDLGPITGGGGKLTGFFHDKPFLNIPEKWPGKWPTSLPLIVPPPRESNFDQVELKTIDTPLSTFDTWKDMANTALDNLLSGGYNPFSSLGGKSQEMTLSGGKALDLTVDKYPQIGPVDSIADLPISNLGKSGLMDLGPITGGGIPMTIFEKWQVEKYGKIVSGTGSASGTISGKGGVPYSDASYGSQDYGGYGNDKGGYY